MGLPFASVAITGFNTNPPADDGSAVAANQVLWATIKSKLADPLKTAVEQINTNDLAAFAKVLGGAGVATTAVDYTIQATDQGKLVRGTAAAITITTPDATSVTAPFVFCVKNSSTGLITFDGSGSQTVNGLANIILGAGCGALVYTDGANWFTIGEFGSEINVLSEDTSPDVSADFVASYDTSALAPKKIKLSNLPSNLPRGYIDGLTLSNGTDATNDINIAAGKCRDSTDTVDLFITTALGKQLDANWTAGGTTGTTVGGRNSAAGIANSTYQVWAARTAASTAADIYFHTSATAATVLTALQAESGGSAYAYLRLIGSIVRVGGTILAFHQYGDEFWLDTPVRDFNATPASASAVTRALASVPTGIKVLAILQAMLTTPSTAAGGYLYFSSLDNADVAASASNFTVSITSSVAATVTTQCRVWTDTSAQIRTRMSTTGGSDACSALSLGWVHPRGRNG